MFLGTADSSLDSNEEEYTFPAVIWELATHVEGHPCFDHKLDLFVLHVISSEHYLWFSQAENVTKLHILFWNFFKKFS